MPLRTHASIGTCGAIRLRPTLLFVIQEQACIIVVRTCLEGATLMSLAEETTHVLVLGTGEIARHVATLSHTLGHTVCICDPRVDEYAFPVGIETKSTVFADHPWDLPPNTHAVIARAHEGDPESVATLLNHGATQVYLIASRRRAPKVIEAAKSALDNPADLQSLSDPAGIDFGGNASSEIALSIMAEIQWRQRGGSLKLMSERDIDAMAAPTIVDDRDCPGKRS